MKRMVDMLRGGWRLVALVMPLLAPVHAIAQPVHIMYGLVKDTNDLVRFNSLTPGTIEETIHLTGVLADETLRAIDFRPSTGELYALGTDGVSHAPRIYHIDLESRVATPRARTLPGLNMPADWGMTFISDRPRIVSSLGQNMTAGPDSGGLGSFDTAINSPVPPPPVVDAIAADRQFPSGLQRTIFAINRATNSLAYLGGLNGQSGGGQGGIITDIGPLGVTISGSATSLDITTNGALFAAMRPNAGLQSFYTINSSTGQATLVGTIGAGTLQIEGLAVVDPSLTLSPATGVYTSLQRWDFVIVADLLGRGVVSGTAFLDGGVEVTAALASCVIAGTAVPGIATFRCPGVVGALLGPGKHSIDVTLVLTDGAQIHRQVFWTILSQTEP